MIRYLCELCNTAFEDPAVRITTETIDGHDRIDRDELCPICGESQFSEADYCPCGNPKYKCETICKPCRVSLLASFSDFADHLTAEEEAQLDFWMDGDSITNRGKWV